LADSSKATFGGRQEFSLRDPAPHTNPTRKHPEQALTANTINKGSKLGILAMLPPSVPSSDDVKAYVERRISQC
jgi:hypothetical protein